MARYIVQVRHSWGWNQSDNPGASEVFTNRTKAKEAAELQESLTQMDLKYRVVKLKERKRKRAVQQKRSAAH